MRLFVGPVLSCGLTAHPHNNVLISLSFYAVLCVSLISIERKSNLNPISEDFVHLDSHMKFNDWLTNFHPSTKLLFSSVHIAQSYKPCPIHEVGLGVLPVRIIDLSEIPPPTHCLRIVNSNHYAISALFNQIISVVIQLFHFSQLNQRSLERITKTPQLSLVINWLSRVKWRRTLPRPLFGGTTVKWWRWCGQDTGSWTLGHTGIT